MKTPPRIELLNGAALASDNAETLLDTARIAAHKNNFGVASSLSILSSEESIKCIAMATQKFTGDISQKSLSKFFSSHTHKHDFGSVLLLFSVLQQHSYKFMQSIESDESIPDDRKGSAWVAAISNDLEKNPEVVGGELESVSDWRAESNSQKNSGFYVGYSEGWHSPADIPSNEYEKVEEKANLLLQIAKEVVKIGREKPQTEIEELYAKYKRSVVPR